jgi:sterol desaturase/sphingolipid hydroxylase (fatty acid hydroxylase superfamily)
MTAFQFWSMASPIAIVAGALVLIALERRFPYDRRQKFFRPEFWSDLVGYTFIQSYLLGHLITWFAQWIDSSTGISRLHLVSDWPVWVQVAFFIITHDLYIYSFHRLQHKVPSLWRIHEAHHATVDVDWLSGSRSHAIEILINQSIEFLPILLLGAAPEVWLIKITLDALWGMYIHCNVDVKSGWLQKIINGPEMHRWHHAIEIRDGVNFATKFAFWDWLLGTAYQPAAKPSAYGIVEPFPSGYLAQQIHAFKPRVAADPEVLRAVPPLPAAIPGRLPSQQQAAPPAG